MLYCTILYYTVTVLQVRPIERWREHIAYGAAEGTYSTQVHTKPILRREVSTGAAEGEVADAAVVTAEGRLRTWVRLTTSQQLREVLLYLLIWGEAANLRFMPELLCFLFEIARAHKAAAVGSSSSGSEQERDALYSMA